MMRQTYDPEAVERLIRCLVAMAVTDYLATRHPRACVRYVRRWHASESSARRTDAWLVRRFAERERLRLRELLQSGGLTELARAVGMERYLALALGGRYTYKQMWRSFHRRRWMGRAKRNSGQ